jgi:hypothetical protein
MKLYRRLKRSTKQYIIVAFICLIVIGGAASFTSVVITGQIRSEYQALLSSAYCDMSDNQRSVYVALTDINKGEILTKNMAQEKTVYSSQPIGTYISQKEIGMTTLIDIPAGTQILNTMLTDQSISDELREIEYKVININSNIMNNDTVDVLICYPNGELYVVLSKKVMKGIMPESATCFFWLSEEDLLRMSAAIVDAGTYSGELITTKYIEPSIQKASAVTYTPSLQVLSFLEKDPNIVDRCSQELNKTIRKSLENRLAASLETEEALKGWNVSDYEFSSEKTTDTDTKNNDESAVTPSPTIIPLPEDLGSVDPDAGAELGDAKPDNYVYFAREGEADYGE